MTREPTWQGPSPGRQAVGFYEHFICEHVTFIADELGRLVENFKVLCIWLSLGRRSVSWSRACGICSSMNALQHLPAVLLRCRVVEPSFAAAAMPSAATWQGAGRLRLSLSVVNQGPAWGSQGLKVTPAFPPPAFAPGLSCCGSIVALKRVKKLDLSDSTLGGRELVFYVAR